MKLSVSTLGCPSWSFEKVINTLSSLGVSGVEVRGINGVMNFAEIPELSEEMRKKQKIFLRGRA